MVESIPSLLRTIESHISGVADEWYAGLTDDPEACAINLRLDSDHDLAWWQALTSEDAQSVHQALLERGVDGEESSHQDAALYVYVYRK